ncbi:hypothetical protein ONZ45_g8500 [Pleurotus djamor]|nr:hypothetical protein ONZ45_g8500 [Pleurotus djamor]
MSSASDVKTSSSASVDKWILAEIEEVENRLLAQYAREMAEARRKLNEAKQELASIEAEAKGNRARVQRKLRTGEFYDRFHYYQAVL